MSMRERQVKDGSTDCFLSNMQNINAIYLEAESKFE